MNEIKRWMPRGWRHTVFWAVLSAALILLMIPDAFAGPTFNLYGPAAGLQKNTGTTFQNTTAMASDVAAAYIGAPGCSGAVALGFNGNCLTLSTGTVTSLTAGVGILLTPTTITTTGSIALTSVGSAGSCTYCAITFDAQGRETAQVSGAAPPAAANPSGSIGLTAANGTASTYTRSDATHALSQAISPTWSGTHVFTGATPIVGTTTGLSVGTSSGLPQVEWIDSGGGTNSKIWDVFANATDLQGRLINDAFNAADVWLDVTRSGIAVSGIVLGNPTDLPTLTVEGGALFAGPRPSTTTAGVDIGTAGVGGGIAFVNPSGTTDQKIWDITNGASGANDLLFRAVNDAYSAANNFIDISRTGTAITGITLSNPTDQAIVVGDGGVIGEGGFFPGVSHTGAYISGRNSVGVLDLITSSATTNARAWGMFGDGSGTLHFAAIVDTGASGTDAITITRSGATPATIAIEPLGISTGTHFVCWNSGTLILSVEPAGTCGVSSERFKDHISDLSLGLDAVLKLRPVTYHVRPEFDKKEHGAEEFFGFIAEEVEKIAPDLVAHDPDGTPHSLDYGRFSVILVNGEKDLEGQIWQLRTAIGILVLWNCWLTWGRRARRR